MIVLTYQVPKKDALRVSDRQDIAICTSCHERWDHAGRTCARCQTAVQGTQDIGVFLDRYAFGHADCGGVRVMR